uniref:Peptidase A2 domain-containing protein n=1 Tax=Ditylenchus dipsaci TaxID=166011 RepID=A0A915DT70_9BILA
MGQLSRNDRIKFMIQQDGRGIIPVSNGISADVIESVKEAMHSRLMDICWWWTIFCNAIVTASIFCTVMGCIIKLYFFNTVVVNFFVFCSSDDQFGSNNFKEDHQIQQFEPEIHKRGRTYSFKKQKKEAPRSQRVKKTVDYFIMGIGNLMDSILRSNLGKFDNTLLDTGSTLSIIHTSYLEKLEVELEPMLYGANSASGHHIEIIADVF